MAIQMQKALIFFMLASLGQGARLAQSAESYTFTNPAPGSYSSYCTGLDDMGRVTGVMEIGSSPNVDDRVNQLFIWENGEFGIVPLTDVGNIGSVTPEGVINIGNAGTTEYSALWKNGVVNPLGWDGFEGNVTASTGNGVFGGTIRHMPYNYTAHAYVRYPGGVAALTPTVRSAEMYMGTPGGFLVGKFTDFSGNHHLFSWKDGQTQNLLPGQDSYLYGRDQPINPDIGQIAGSYWVQGSPAKVYAYVWREGVFTTLFPDSTHSTVNTTNSAGQLEGTYEDAEKRSHAFTWENGVLTDLSPGETQENSESFVHRMTEDGRVLALEYTEGHVYRAFTWKDGIFSSLTPPGAVSSQGMDISPDGAIIGSSANGDGAAHAWVFKDNTLIKLGPEELTNATDLHVVDAELPDRYLIEWIDAERKSYAFLWDNGVYQSIESPVSAASVWIDQITDTGFVGGVYGRQAGQGSHPFVWYQGKSTDLSHPSEVYGEITAMGNGGEVAGLWHIEDPVTKQIVSHPFLWKSGSFQRWEDPAGGKTDRITEIDDAGYWIGQYREDDTDGLGGFIWKDGEYLSPAGDSSPFVGRPNAQGVRIVTYREANTSRHSLIIEDGQVTELDDFLPPSAYSSSVAVVNASGQIAGDYYDSITHARHAFLLTPGPFVPFEQTTNLPSVPVAVQTPTSLPASESVFKVSKKPPRTTTRRAAVVRGKSSGQMSYRSSGQKWRIASQRPSGKWRIRPRLKYGRNLILIRSEDGSGKRHVERLHVYRKRR